MIPHLAWARLHTGQAFYVALLVRLGGCVTTYPFRSIEPPPYMLLPVDEMAIVRRYRSLVPVFGEARRPSGILAVGRARLAGTDLNDFREDAPRELVDERRRLDALSDLQREKGCVVMEPGPLWCMSARSLRVRRNEPQEPVILKSRG